MRTLYEILVDAGIKLRTATAKERCFAMPKNHKATFTIHVNPSPLEISFSPDGGKLPDETVGMPVDGQVVTVIDGGTRPYTVVVTLGSLPVGVTLMQGTSSVVLQGAPTTPGDYSFEITATDSGA
jgi:hypothetical protein